MAYIKRILRQLTYYIGARPARDKQIDEVLFWVGPTYVDRVWGDRFVMSDATMHTPYTVSGFNIPEVNW